MTDKSAAKTQWVLVPREPAPELINSMVMRFDHGAFAPAGQEVLGVPMGPKTEEERLARINMLRTQMRQLHEEVVGLGFCKPAHQEEGEAAALIAWLHEQASDHESDAMPVTASKFSTAASTLLSQASQIEALRKERDEAHAIAKRLSGALVDLTPGGSEYFSHSAALDDYFADTQACTKVIRDRFDSGHQAKIERVDERRRAESAETKLAEAIKVIEPFAEASANLDDSHPDGSPIWDTPAAMGIDAKHLRSAQAFLDANGGGQ